MTRCIYNNHVHKYLHCHVQEYTFYCLNWRTDLSVGPKKGKEEWNYGFLNKYEILNSLFTLRYKESALKLTKYVN
jgi:hypothetical protein